MFGGSTCEVVIEDADFSVTYNPDTTQGMMGDSDGGEETALIMRDMPCGKDGHMWTGRQTFILKGDWRDDYKKAYANGEGRWGLFWGIYRENRKKHGSRWSYDFHDWGKDGRPR